MGLFDGFSSVRTQKGSDLSPAESFAGIILATVLILIEDNYLK
jgi:hypothetical protein